MRAKQIAARIIALLPTLFLAVILLLPSELPLALPTLSALILHELGHLFAFFRLGEPTPRLSLAKGGLRLMSERPLSHSAEGLIALGGPAANLLVAALLLALSVRSGGGREYLIVCAALNLSAGLWNLLPIGDLDGARILSALLSPLPHRAASTVLALVSHLTLLFALSVSLCILHFSGACFYTSLALLLLLPTEL